MAGGFDRGLRFTAPWAGMCRHLGAVGSVEGEKACRLFGLGVLCGRMFNDIRSLSGAHGWRSFGNSIFDRDFDDDRIFEDKGSG